MRKKINYVSAPCGSGKTFAAIEQSILNAKMGKKILVAQPTIDCINEWFDKTKCRFSDTFKFHSKENDKVSTALIEHLNGQSDRDGEIVFITHQTLMNLKYFPNSYGWELIVDEIPSITNYIQHNFTDHSKLLTQLVSMREVDDLHLIISNDDDELRQIVNNKYADQVNELLAPLADGLLADDVKIIGLPEQFADNYTGLFNFLLVRQASCFDRFGCTTIMGANFEQSLPFKIWDYVDWTENVGITSRLRYKEHPNGDLLVIEYMFNKISKTMLDKTNSDGITNHQSCVEHIRKNYVDFVYLDNLGRNTTFTDGVKLPAISHGINAFDGFSNVAVIGSYLSDPYEQRLMKQLGLNSTELKQARHQDIVYQAILRTSLRDVRNSTPVRVFVPDEETAIFLQAKFDKSKLMFVGKQDISKKQELKNQMRSLLEKRSEIEPISNKALLKNSSIFCLINNNSSGFVGSLFTSTWDKSATAIEVTDLDEFIENLRECSKQHAKSKKDNVLISPAKFGDLSSRTRDNVISAKHLWVDVDNGTMTDIEFAKAIAPIKCVTFNTASSIDRTRFRAIIPTTTEMTAELYHQLMLHIRCLVVKAGYSNNKTNESYHGIDRSKLHPENLMYLPSMPVVENGLSFFNVHAGEVLNPLSIIDELDIRDNVIELKPALIRTHSMDIKDDVANDYRQISKGIGERHNGFFKACYRLYANGYSLTYIQQIMPEIDYDSSRKGNYQNIIKSLKQYGRQ